MSEETDTSDAEESAPTDSVVYVGAVGDGTRANVGAMGDAATGFVTMLEAAPAAAAAAAFGVTAAREAGKTVRTAMQEKTKRQAIEAGQDGGPEPLAAEQAPDTD